MFPFPLKCPLYFFTSIHCPTCGLGRGLIAAVQGQWALSWSYHPLAIPLLFLAGITLIGLLYSPHKVKALGDRIVSPLQSHPRTTAVGFVFYSVWGFGRWLV